jgi:hypothetical protein
VAEAFTAFEALTISLGALNGVETGQMFGKRCLSIKGKAFLALHKQVIAFKLGGAPHEAALALPGAALWDPSGKGRPMKDWVAMPASQAAAFDTVARAALAYVSGQP